MTSTRTRPHPLGIATLGIAIAMLTAACMNSNEPDVTEQQLRDVVVIAANDTLQALGLEPFANVNDVKITTCTDALGFEEDERFSEFAKNPPISDTELTDEQITNLAQTLGIEFSVDSRNSFGTRRLAFSVDIDGINVFVDIVRDPDGSAGIATSTLCLG